MAVSKRLRYEVLRRDNHTCRYCGATAPGAKLTIDHVAPEALGGANTPDNLITACEPCNSGKSSSTPDATLVADVAEGALQWAAAMQQAAQDLRAQTGPKLAYQATFQDAWNGWNWEHNGKTKTFDLPPGWKSSLDNFREAGLPQEVWPDIIEKAMTNKMVRADNLFRYCCGIAWRMVGELQGRARATLGAAPAGAAPVDSVVQAAVDVWVAEQSGDVGNPEQAQFRASVAGLREQEDAHRLLHAAQYAAWFGGNDAAAALSDIDRAEAFQQWSLAWYARTGEFPDEKRANRVTAQINTLLNANVHAINVARAAAYAGSRRIAYLHFGLSENERELVDGLGYVAKSLEVWMEAFYSASGDWPTDTERAAFLNCLQRIGADGEIWIADIYPAAAAAGAYQDPDISTCLTRHLSVFEVAARPLQPAA